jgi:hypothetical protein
MYGLAPFALVTHNIDIWIKVMEWYQILSYTHYLNAIMPENYLDLVPMYDFARAMSIPNMFGDVTIPNDFQIAPEPFNSLGIIKFINNNF